MNMSHLHDRARNHAARTVIAAVAVGLDWTWFRDRGDGGGNRLV